MDYKFKTEPYEHQLQALGALLRGHQLQQKNKKRRIENYLFMMKI
jgi:hypothetical protein